MFNDTCTGFESRVSVGFVLPLPFDTGILHPVHETPVPTSSESARQLGSAAPHTCESLKSSTQIYSFHPSYQIMND